MAKVNIPQDADKSRLKARYSAALTRLQQIEDNAVGSNLVQSQQALSDMAQILSDTLKITRKVVEREL